MNGIYFLIRHTPFWAVPTVMVAFEFGYIYWLRKRKKVATGFFGVGCFALSFLIYYYIIGGPEKSVDYFIGLVQGF